MDFIGKRIQEGWNLEGKKSSVSLSSVCVWVVLQCSVVGATVIAIGFYTVMWGKSKEEMEEDEETTADILESSSSTEKIPLLRNFKSDVNV